MCAAHIVAGGPRRRNAHSWWIEKKGFRQPGLVGLIHGCAKRRTTSSPPAVKDIPIGELVEFDYKGRGYRLSHE
jgi:hypothetical protein